MGRTTTFEGRVRSRGGRRAGSPTVSRQCVIIAFDYAQATPTPVRVGTSATSGPTLTLPKGTIVLNLTKLVAVTGGTSPLTDIGILGGPDHFYSDLSGALANISAPNGTVHLAERLAGGTTADHLVYANNGSGTPGTGISVCVLEYLVYDDGSFDSAV